MSPSFRQHLLLEEKKDTKHVGLLGVAVGKLDPAPNLALKQLQMPASAFGLCGTEPWCVDTIP